MRLLISVGVALLFCAGMFWNQVSIYRDCRVTGNTWTRCVLVVEKEIR